MNEIIYSINGKFLKDFQITVSKSDGVFDILKRKPIKTYDWSEYNGNSPDLSSPKFEPREIKLDCFVVGEDFDDMMNNFNSIFRDEFMKSGVQELIIIPFAYKERIYHVYLDSEIQLKKTFKKGKIAATFSVKLIEPNPIKKVLKLIGDSLNLSYNSPNETEIFYGNGLKETAKGNVSLSGKLITDRIVGNYSFHGRNLWIGSELPNLNANDAGTGTPLSMTDETGSFIRVEPSKGNVVSVFGRLIPNYENRKYSHSIWIRHAHTSAITIWGQSIPPNVWTWLKQDSYDYPNGHFIIASTISDLALDFKKAKIEKNATATPWTIAPEEEKYITIAGNINEITNLTTNAPILWELL